MKGINITFGLVSGLFLLRSVLEDIAGDVDEVLRRLLQMIEETGPFGVLVNMSYDWDDKQSWLYSMELFARELMPALNKAVGAVAV